MQLSTIFRERERERSRRQLKRLDTGEMDVVNNQHERGSIIIFFLKFRIYYNGHEMYKPMV